jgi:hypothetical protein
MTEPAAARCDSHHTLENSINPRIGPGRRRKPTATLFVRGTGCSPVRSHSKFYFQIQFANHREKIAPCRFVADMRFFCGAITRRAAESEQRQRLQKFHASILKSSAPEFSELHSNFQRLRN